MAEAPTNVAKHARAERVEVRAFVAENVLHLEVRDDGVGGARRDGRRDAAPQDDDNRTTGGAMTHSVLLVPGSWHGAWAFETLTPHLTEAGFSVHSLDLPSNGSAAGLLDDAAVVRAKLDRIAEPTIVVGHSYGGIAVSEGAAQSPQAVALIYLCAFMLEPGQSLVSARQDGLPPWIELDEVNGTQMARDAEAVLYGDCAPSVARAATRRLVPQSVAAVDTPQTAAAWQHRPSTYVVCTRDLAIPVPLQETMAARATSIRRLNASHSPFLSRPHDVVRVVREAVP